MKKTTAYLFAEILGPFLVVGTVLSAIAAAYITTTSLVDPTDLSLQPRFVVYLVFVRLVAILDVIIPTALFFAVIFGVGRLYRDGEIVALLAAGFSERRLMRGVFAFALIVSLLAGVASNVGRPWAFRIYYAIQARASAELDVDNIRAGELVELEASHQLLLARSVEVQDRSLADVVLYTDVGNETSRLVVAQHLRPPTTTPGRLAKFEEGRVYWIDKRGAADRSLEFDSLTVPLGGSSTPRNRRKAADTLQLAHAKEPPDAAEFQWRIAAPATTLLLALLAVPLSHETRRAGTQARTVLAIVAYAAFFGLFAFAHSLVEKGYVPPFPGVWWSYIAPLATLWFLLAKPLDRRRSRTLGRAP